MPKSGLNVALKGLDDIFSTEESRQEEQREQVQQIPVSELFPFKNHPFKVLDDDSMTRTVESISQFGVLAREMCGEFAWFIASADGEPCGYLSVQQEAEELFHLQKIYVLPRFQGLGVGEFLFRHAVEYVRSVHPAPCRMELNVNRNNKAVGFYEHMGMKKSREGDFPIGNGYYMNDYIMQLKIEE